MSRLLAGVGVRDITPAPGLPLWGYADRAGSATGTIDPLQAKAIAFHADGPAVVWVSLDLGRTPLVSDCDWIREAVKDAGVDHVVFAATHTHHAPMMELIEDPERQKMLNGIRDAILEAHATLQPVRMGYTTCTIDVAHNRRRITEDGRCLMLWRNQEMRRTEPVDREATIVAIDTEAGEPLAVLVHFACHPVVMDGTNLQYSGDYVATLTRIVTGMTDRECIFIQGACGDINPYLDKTPVEEGGIDAAFSVGRLAGETIFTVLHDVQTAAPANPSVSISEKPVEVGVRWDMEDAELGVLLQEVHGGLYDRYMKGLGSTLEVPLTVVQLNGELGLIGMPGEFFVRYQLELKRFTPLRHALLCGYVNDHHAYFPPVSDVAAGGYGGAVGTYVGIGAAEKLFTEGQIELYRLLGRLKDRYSEEDFAIYDEGPVPD